MISLCSVMIEKLEDKYKDVFLESILRSTKLISEVVIANNDKDTTYFKCWEERGISFKEYGSQENFRQRDCGSQHGLGLNYAIDKATNEYVYLCDPDIFFYSAAEEFFLNLKFKYDLHAIGGSHHSAAQLAGTYFPWHGNILVCKSDLPPASFLEDELPVKGKYLLAGAGHSHAEIYPNPTGNFDTASSLWLWSKQSNWRWLAFQTLDTHLYTTQYHRGNCKITEKFEKQKLFYHAVSGSIETAAWEPYFKAYKESVEE